MYRNENMRHAKNQELISLFARFKLNELNKIEAPHVIDFYACSFYLSFTNDCSLMAFLPPYIHTVLNVCALLGSS